MQARRPGRPLDPLRDATREDGPMALTLFYHPLSSFCWKVLIALYENAVPFTGRIVDLGSPADRAAFARLWPLAKFPVLQDGDRIIPESSVIIEHLARHHAGPVALLPADGEAALEARARDRFFDLHVHLPMQKIVGDRLRPAGAKDPAGVDQARATLATALGIAEDAVGTWACGDAFTLADCAAMPALHYADLVQPFGDAYPRLRAYGARLAARPAVARVLREAEPYRALFPR
jgi:glutathione S-transferase